MDYIGKRISIKKKEDEISIVILSTADKFKKNLLFIAFFLWSLSGMIVFLQYFYITDQQTRVALIVWLGFWAYFEYRIFKAYMWRSSGIEKLKLRNGKFYYKREVAKRGKIKVFEYDFMKDLRLIEPKENSFFESLDNSYWVVAGEKLAFDYYGKEIKFGLQLDETDAKTLFKFLQKEIK